MRLKKVLFVLTFMFAIFLQQNMVAQAEESFLNVKVTTDKEGYNKNDVITYDITVTNSSEYTANDVAVTTVLPEELELVSEGLNIEGKKITWHIEKIEAEDEAQLQFKAKLKSTDSVAPPIKNEVNPSEDENNAPPQTTPSEGKGSATPQTGDNTNLLGYFLLLLASTAVLFIGYRALRKKRMPKEITYLLILALLLPSFSVAKAAEFEQTIDKNITVVNSHNTAIDGNEYEVKTTVSAVFELTETLVESIEATPSEMELAPGESKALVVKALNEAGDKKDISAEDDVSYEVSDSSVLTVEKDTTTNKAYVTASENAQDGDTATVNITYASYGKTFTAQVSVTIVDEILEGTVSGDVVDALDETPLSGVSIKLFDGEELVKELETLENGSYETNLLPGTYTLDATHPGYVSANLTFEIEATDTTVYNPRLKMVREENSGPGIASGKIINGVTGFGVPGITIDIRKGKDNITGEVIETITSDDQGNYSVELPGGNYTIEVSGEGYITTSENIVSIGGETMGNQNATLSPDNMNDDNIRIILTWEENPRDLDSHLTGPTADGERFHVYWSRKQYSDSENEANLDLDDVTSYGPETVTVIKNLSEGTYTYAVHNYTDREQSNLNLSNSGATVRIYKGLKLLDTFYVPTSIEGNVWRVFEIRNGDIVRVNSIDYIEGWSSPEYFAPAGE